MRFFKLVLFSLLLFAARQVEAQCPSIAGATSTVTDVTCFGFSDGTIRLKLNAGGTPTNFELYDNNLGQTVPSNVGGLVKVIDADSRGVTFTSVYASNFSVYIYKIGCVPNPLVYSPGGGLNVNEPVAIVANPAITPDCNPATGPGNQAGSINLNASGGTNPLTYAWSDGPTAQNRPNIDAGTYSVTITDKNGCTLTLSNLVVPGSPTITFGSIPSVCSGVTNSTLSYSATTDAPDLYRIDWVSGITDVALTALPSSPISITGIPVGVGTYNGTLFVRNSVTLCESIGYAISVTVSPLPVVSTPSANLCVGATMNASPVAGGTWVSSAPGVASINNAGLITGISPGSATFTFTSAAGCSATTASVTIGALSVVSIPSNTLCVGATMNASPNSGGSWVSSAPAVATINNAGLITGISPGSATFTFSTVGCSVTTATVTVNALPIVSIPSATLCVGKTMSASPGVGGTWVSSAPGVATISNAGLITGLSAGTATFTFTSTATGCSSTTATVTINSAPVVSTPSTSLCVGTTMNASPGVGGTWVSSAPGVATISNAGLITGISAGSAIFTFTATASGCSTSTANVTVNTPPVVSTPSASLCIGSTMNASPGVGGTWVSSAPGIATINNTGLITGISAGSATFTFTSTTTGCSATTASATIQVLPVVSTPSASLCVGVTMNATPNAGGTWVSSAPGVATITNAGLITGISAGAVTFTFTSTASGCSATTASVTINARPVVSTPSASLCVGATMTATPSAGGTWVSSAPGVAMINNAGLITGISAGNATFTFTSTATGCAATTTSVTVNAAPVVSTPSASLCVGATMSASPGVGGTWVSSAPGVATITNAGLITGISAGNATFTFTSTATGCAATTASVTVNAAPVVSTPSASLCVGFTMSASPGVGGTWVSSAPGVATINNAGLITGISAGNATFTFTATATGCSASTASVTVNTIPVVSTPSASICVGSTMNASPGVGGTWVSSAPGVATITNAGLITGISAGIATFTFTSTATGCSKTTSSITINAPPLVSTPSATLCIGATMNASPGAGGIWISNASGVATITNAGLVTGISSGTVTFTFFSIVTGCSATTSTVTINTLPVVSTPSANLCVGATMNASPGVGGTWVSSTPGVATIDNAGLITGISAGTVTFTFTAAATSCSNTTLVVTVDNTPNQGLAMGVTINPVCIGGQSNVTVAGSEVGVTYQLRNNADNSLIGASVVGTGAGLLLPTGPLNATTTFNVLASRGGCSLPLNSTATVTVLGNIDASLSVSAQNSPLCEGLSTNIFVNNTEVGVTYRLVDATDNSLVGSAISGTGGVISFPTGILASTKVFKILASNASCSIELTNTATVNVDINPDPNLAVTTSPSPLCIGAATNVTVAASEMGVNYQLRNDSNNSLIGSPIAGTGSSIDLPTGVLNATITFNILATGGVCVPVQLNNKVSITVSGSINLALVPAPVLPLVCGGGSTTIRIPNSEVGVNYQLINDSDNSLLPGIVAGTGGTINLPTGNLSITTTFRVSAKNASCSAELLAKATVNVTPLPSSVLPVHATSFIICEWNSTIIRVTNSELGISYQLRNDADNSLISSAVIGTGNTIDLPTGILRSTILFNVFATNGTCSIELNQKVLVVVLDAPDETLSVVAQDPTVCNGNSTIIQVLNSKPGVIYQLRDNADNSLVSGAAVGNGGTINLPTGPIIIDRTFNVLASNTLCSIQLTATATVSLKAFNDPTCSNCSSVIVTTINATKVTCNASVPDGSIEFDIQPPNPVINNIGVIIEIIGPTSKTQTDNVVFTGLAAGDYAYTITYGDENNPDCIKVGTFIIEVSRLPDPIDFDLTVDEFNCLTDNGSITLANISGTPGLDFQYSIFSNGSTVTQGAIPSSATSFDIKLLVIGDYEAQLSQNQEATNGCVGMVTSSLVSFTIAQPPGGCGVIIPNVFTPNGDGANDVFQIRNLPPNSRVTVTNRWGKEVFASSNYQNNWSATDVSDGIYYYRIVMDGDVQTGWLEILR